MHTHASETLSSITLVARARQEHRLRKAECCHIAQEVVLHILRTTRSRGRWQRTRDRSDPCCQEPGAAAVTSMSENYIVY